MDGTVVAIHGQILFVRLDGERWKNLPPLPATPDELELQTQ